MPRFGAGEGKPDIFEGKCAGGCGRNGKKNRFGTCGRQKCIDAVNRQLAGADVDARDPASGRKVKINGKWHTVKSSGSNRHGHFVRLQDGHTVSLDNVQEWKD